MDEQSLDQLSGMSLEMILGVVGLVVLRQLCEIAAKEIPDSATGALALARVVLKTVAMYRPNKK